MTTKKLLSVIFLVGVISLLLFAYILTRWTHGAPVVPEIHEIPIQWVTPTTTSNHVNRNTSTFPIKLDHRATTSANTSRKDVSARWPDSNAPDWLAGKCPDKLCKKYLLGMDLYHFNRMTSVTKSQPGPNPRCHFMDGKGRAMVGLVSVPGAGNTWIRSLLEQATGICTGSIYTDEALRLGGFLGEFVQGTSVLLVKSHTSDFQWKGEVMEDRNHEDALYDSIIFLIRNPYDTFVSERNRVVSLIQLGGYWPKPPGRIDVSHTRLIDKSNFGNNPEWERFIHKIAERWVKTLTKWVLHPVSRRKKIMVLRFEDVQADKIKEVLRMLKFINFPHDEKTVRDRLSKADYTVFRRNHTEHYEHFTAEQKKWINNMLLETIEHVQKCKMEDAFRLHEYIAKV